MYRGHLFEQERLERASKRQKGPLVSYPGIRVVEYPELVFPNGYRLECLHGQHRIQAAQRIFLPARDKWWTVALYLTGITESCSVGWESTDVGFLPGANQELKTCLIDGVTSTTRSLEMARSTARSGNTTFNGL